MRIYRKKDILKVQLYRDFFSEGRGGAGGDMKLNSLSIGFLFSNTQTFEMSYLR